MDDNDWEWYENVNAEIDKDFEVKPGGVYTTYDQQKAVVMYLLKEKNKAVFFGHVFEGAVGAIAVQWDALGKVDDRLHDRGYNLESVWEKPKKHLRIVWIFKDVKGSLITKVSETEETLNDLGTLIAKTKVVLTEF